jgi:hypothetical protein
MEETEIRGMMQHLWDKVKDISFPEHKIQIDLHSIPDRSLNGNDSYHLVITEISKCTKCKQDHKRVFYYIDFPQKLTMKEIPMVLKMLASDIEKGESDQLTNPNVGLGAMGEM